MSSTVTRSKQYCMKCPKGYGHTFCGGCQQWLCYRHLQEHRQELALEMDHLSQERDTLYDEIFRNNADHEHPLLTQIHQWEQTAIQQIQQVAAEVRLKLTEYHQQRQTAWKESLEYVTRELQRSRENDDFSEIELKTWSMKFEELRQQFKNPFDTIRLMYADRNRDEILRSKLIRFIELKQEGINRELSSTLTIPAIEQWTKTGTTILGNIVPGQDLNQLAYPCGIFIDEHDDRTLYIADCGNHRILAWRSDATDGTIVAGGHGKGSANNQLHDPIAVLMDPRSKTLIISDCGNRRIVRWSRENNRILEILLSDIICYGFALDQDSKLYVCDYERHEVRCYSESNPPMENGTIVAGGHGQGHCLNQLNGPWDVFVDAEHTVYVSDHNNHRVMKWFKDANEGVIIAGGAGAGNSMSQLSGPTGLFVDSSKHVFIVDRRNHRLMRYSMDNTQITIIVGGSGVGNSANQLNVPSSLSFDQHGNLLVSDYKNHRIQRFSIIS